MSSASSEREVDMQVKWLPDAGTSRGELAGPINNEHRTATNGSVAYAVWKLQ
jgi:hypothetical protein